MSGVSALSIIACWRDMSLKLCGTNSAYIAIMKTSNVGTPEVWMFRVDTSIIMWFQRSYTVYSWYTESHIRCKQ